MSRLTIDFGIDLGTTNSSIAMLNGVKAEIIKSNLDTDIISSAVYIGKTGNMYVGSRAKQKLEDNRSAEDAYIEFKRRMGSDFIYNFKSAHIRKTPEELSAEVLKTLKGNVKQRLDEDISAAVITIPAAFAQVQCVATKKAAELAGFTQCPLLQEPVAASLAYGFQKNTDRRSFWLVFDFGGGTFDAAVMKAEDGDIQVVNHGGDNFLGGADIDWGIIEKIIVPQIVDDYNLPDFKRGNPKWMAVFAKIKRAVENAKIDLSRNTEAFLDGCIFEDDDGEEIELDGLRLTQSQVSDIAEPLIERAVQKCKQVLSEKNLSASAIEKTILVGGPTLAPYFRTILSDKLGIPLDYNVDPLTVVSQGAAIFAGTQRLDKSSRTVAPIDSGTYKLALIYQPIGPDDDPSVVGEVVSPNGEDLSSYSIEFVNRVTRWSSGSIQLNSEGKFHLRLRAEPECKNIFDISLCDRTGSKQETDISEITYTIGVSIKSQITCSDISIEKANNEVVLLVPKGTPYPFKKINRKFTTVVELKKGESSEIVIPVLEAIGGNAGRLGDHNKHLGSLVLSSSSLSRDIPVGSDIEITISAKEPGALFVEAYVPLVDETFKTKINYDTTYKNEKQLRDEFEKENSRVFEFDYLIEENEDINKKIDELVSDINSLWDSVDSVEGANQIEMRIIELRIILDDIEESSKFPEKIREIKEKFGEIEEYASEMNNSQKSTLSSLKKRVADVEESKDALELERVEKDVMSLWIEVYADRFDFWASILAYMYKNRGKLPQTAEVNNIFERGARAMQEKNKDVVRKCVFSLWEIAPPEVVEESKRGHGSGITI